MLTLLWQVKVLLRQIREIGLWHHIVLLLALHDEVLCSLLSKAMMVVISTSIVSLNLRVALARMLRIACLSLHLSIWEIDMVLGRRHLRLIVV